MRKVLGVIALGLLTAACGTNQEQRTATGGLIGVGIGALAGGPVGAAIGLGAGVVGGALMPEDATAIANNALGREHRAANVALGMPDRSNVATARPADLSGSSMRSAAPAGLVKEAQTQLKDQGLYNGQIDGIAGPQTRRAVRAYQKREGLRQTARLDRETVQHMNITASAPVSSNAASGSSAPQENATPDNQPPRNASPSADQPPGPAPQNQ